MLRALRVIQIRVRFVPAPVFSSTMQSNSESMKNPNWSRTASSTAKSYAPKDLPAYDYDLVVLGGGSGGTENQQNLSLYIRFCEFCLGLAAAKEAAKLNKNAKVIQWGKKRFFYDEIMIILRSLALILSLQLIMEQNGVSAVNNHSTLLPIIMIFF